MERKPSKRPWRKFVKKLQRKRRRQKLARQRDRKLEESELEKLNDPLYKLLIKQKEAMELEQQLAGENEHKEQEQLWLRREMLAQKQFKKEELKRQVEENKLTAERLKQEKELKLLEEARQKKREEIKLQTEKMAKDFDIMMTCMQEYLEDLTMKTPTRLESFVQSRPGEKSCDFFDKTNCCRFGPGCSFNHKRPLLSKIILIKHFFQHPLLEQQEHKEYSKSDSELELNERDLRESYDEFCEDVWSVLEEFGQIVNFRTVRNVQAHLRGHVFVEYAEKRSSLKAFINLQNRYYASKRLNVEFSNIRNWRTGVCGLSLGRKCPKGVKCNFLHLMKNICNKYNKPIDNPERYSLNASKNATTVTEATVVSWNSEVALKNRSIQSRNWRWSESPEIELKPKNEESNFKQETYNEKKNSFHSSHKKSSRRKSNSPKCRSYSPCLDRNKFLRNQRPKSPSLRHHKNKERTSGAEKKENLKRNKRTKRKKSNSHRHKSLHKRSSSPNLHNEKSTKKSRSKSPLRTNAQR